MSDSQFTTSSSANPLPTTGPDRRRKATQTLFLFNGVVCCVLITALVVFGLRAKQRTEGDGSGAEFNPDNGSAPIASATDTSEDEDDNNGRPKAITIEMKWPGSGVADFEFTERSGRTVTNKDLIGHPWVAGFIFSNCAGPCFKVSSAMRALQDEFGQETDLRFVSFTVDPERDTPEVLNKYATGFRADPEKWLFLTGDKSELYRLILGSFLMPVGEEEGERRQPGFEFIHTTNILLVDEKGVVQGKWASTDEAQFAQLRRELRKRFGKSSGNTVPKLEVPPLPESTEPSESNEKTPNASLSKVQP